MMKTATLAVLLALANSSACTKPSDPPSPTPPTGPGYDCSRHLDFQGLVPVANAIAGQYIVVLKPRPTGIQPLLDDRAVRDIQTGVTDVKTMRQGYAAKLAASALTRLLADPQVQYIQEDGIKSVNPTRVAATQSWGLDRIDQRERLPLDGEYAPGADGAGVNVAIVDTGIAPHADFEGRLQIDCFTAHGDCKQDGHGHGTHVAGTVGGKTWGVAKKASLYAVRVLNDSGSGSDSQVIRGVEWVAAKKRANPSESWVANLSLGGSPSPALDQAVCDAIETGVAFAVAAGNEADQAETSSPARVLQALTVGASDQQDWKASFSNYGVLLDVFAPGTNIQSTQPGGGTDTMSGTSMASPHVAGAAALYLQRHPGATPAQVVEGIVASATVNKIQNPGAGSANRLLYVKD